MKPFDSDAAKRGDPVITRAGHSARFICDDLKGCAPLGFAIARASDREELAAYTISGQYHPTIGNSDFDLFMAVKKVTKWANIYGDDRAFLYDSKELANQAAGSAILRCVKIEFDE
jgi:hypothetical protein